jgi:hypothetical protein
MSYQGAATHFIAKYRIPQMDLRDLYEKCETPACRVPRPPPWGPLGEGWVGMMPFPTAAPDTRI